MGEAATGTGGAGGTVAAAAPEPAPGASPEPGEGAGLLLGLAGVAIFSLTLPVTRLAVAELDAWFVAFGRMALAGLAAGLVLILGRAPPPTRRELGALLAVAGGVVLGFPLFSTLAVREVSASHGGVVLAVLPLATAAAAALLGGERPSPRFWLAAAAGAAVVLAFALWRSRGAPARADLYLLLACALCAVGYAAGGRLARRMPGLRVIAWALVLTLPLSAVLALLRLPAAVGAGAGPGAWAAFLYVALMSQFLGFYFWYGGLARGGIAKVGQVQLLQTFMTLAASALLVGERVDPATWLFAAAAVGAVWLARRAPVRRGG